MVFLTWKIRQAFNRVKRDITTTRQILTNAVFSLSTEYAKLKLQVQDLEHRMEQLEEGRVMQRNPAYSFARSY